MRKKDEVDSSERASSTDNAGMPASKLEDAAGVTVIRIGDLSPDHAREISVAVSIVDSVALFDVNCYRTPHSSVEYVANKLLRHIGQIAPDTVCRISVIGHASNLFAKKLAANGMPGPIEKTSTSVGIIFNFVRGVRAEIVLRCLRSVLSPATQG